MEKLQVFISWSGLRAEAIAKLVKQLLVDVVRQAEVWISSEDLRKGRQWLPDLNEKLRSTKFGILILTPESVNKPWLLFEAGAISKALPDNHCCPLLCGLTHADITAPLSQFNGAIVSKREDVLKLVATMYEAAGATGDPVQLERWFAPFWDSFEKATASILQNSPSDAKSGPHRSSQDLVEEILELVRRQTSGIAKIESAIRHSARFQARVPAFETLRDRMLRRGFQLPSEIDASTIEPAQVPPHVRSDEH